MKIGSIKFVKDILGSKIGYLYNFRYAPGERSWSQEGEDRVLWRYFEYLTSGFYIDVGAHHPFRFSNTCLLFKAGWSGINIDAMPGSMAGFRKHRPKDINLEIGISDVPGVAKFHVFSEPALNTFDAGVAHQHSLEGRAVERVVNVPLRSLRDVIAEYRPTGSIELLSVDAEGHDLNVLKSNDWDRFRPRVVLAESLGRTIDDLNSDPCAQFMADVSYAAFAKTVNTVVYVDLAAR